MFQIKLKTGLHYAVVYTQQDTQRSFQSTRKRVYLFFVFCIYLYCLHFSEVQTSLWFHIPKDCSLSQPRFNPSRLHTAKCNQSHWGVRGQCQAGWTQPLPVEVQHTSYEAFECISVGMEPAFIVTIKILTHLSLMKERSPLPTSGHPLATSTEIKQNTKVSFPTMLSICKPFSSQPTWQKPTYL